MPIMGIEERNQNQDRERTRERIREHGPMTQAVPLRGTITELSGGPDYAPYQGDEWDGLGKRVTPSPMAFKWQEQFDQFWSKLKTMLGMK